MLVRCEHGLGDTLQFMRFVPLLGASHVSFMVQPMLLHLLRDAPGLGDVRNYWTDDPLTGPAWAAARHLWKHADLTPEDVDVAQIYDAFTPLIPLSLEGYGFCGRGEGGAFTEGGALETGGRLPLNTGGGGLSEAYVHGFNLITEGVKQLRGTSTAQVPGAATCLVTAGEGVPTSALLLRN